MPFDTAIARLSGIEGGHVNDPDDSGGPTGVLGITEGLARAHGYTGDMRALPRDLALRIARLEFWNRLRLDEVDVLSPAIAFELFEQGYHFGATFAALHLQRALNSLNNLATRYPDVVDDGALGPVTVDTLRIYLGQRGKQGETVLLRVLNSLQCAKLHDLVRARKKDEKYFYGWVLNRVVI